MTATETGKRTGQTNGQTNGTNGAHAVGRSVSRIDALEKVTGRAQYTADLHLPGMCHGVFLRSP
jgi:hypothetical protein